MGGSLRISSTNFSNEGTYICEARNTFGRDKGYVHLRVRQRRKYACFCVTLIKQQRRIRTE